MPRPEVPGVELVQATERERILKGARELVMAVISHYVFEEKKQLPENCPFIFFDEQSKEFILGDVFFGEIQKKSIRHGFGSILVQAPAIEAAAEIIDTVIGNQEKDMVYFIDQTTCDALAGLKGTTIKRKDLISLEGTLQRPTGIMPFVLPKETTGMSSQDIPGLAITF